MPQSDSPVRWSDRRSTDGRVGVSYIALNPKCVGDASARRMAPWMRARDELS